MRFEISRLFRVNEKPILLFLIFLFLLTWAGSTTYLALQNKSEMKVLVVGKHGPEAVRTGKDLSIVEPEYLKVFVRGFIMKTYNFSPEDFLEKANESSSYISESLWNQNVTNLKQKFEDVKLRKITQIGTILEWKEVSNSEIRLLVKVESFKQDGDDPRELSKEFMEKNEVTIKIRSVDFSLNNEWGYEIEDLNIRRI